MSKDFSESLTNNVDEKKYTSRELIRGFARFPSIGAAENSPENEFTKHWLWNSLMLCQHYLYKENNLTKSRIRQILNLQISPDGFKDPEKSSYKWLKDAHEKHPEVKDLVESLLRFLETNTGEYKNPNYFRSKTTKDYLNFGGKTLYVMGSAVVAALFLPNILAVGGVFVALTGVGIVANSFVKKSKKKKFDNSVKKTIIELDNMSLEAQGKELLELISLHNYGNFQNHADVKEVFDKLLLTTKRFASLHQKHEAKMEDLLNVKNIWANTMPSLIQYDLSDAKVREYVVAVMGKMLFLLNRIVQDLMKIELNQVMVENEFWNNKIASENADDIKLG